MAAENFPVSLENNIELYGRWVNPEGKGPIIVFLHEGLGSIAQWKDFPEKVCALHGHKGLVYERQGYGASSPISKKRDENYLHDYALNELPAVLKKLGLEEEEIILYGHSDGGSIAYIYASNFPQNIVGIISEAAHVFVEDITLEGITPVVDIFKEGKLKSALEKYHGPKTEQTFYAWSDTWHLKRFREWNIEEGLENINCPVLAIQGEDDEYGSEEQLDKIINGVGASAEKLFIPNCGHSPWKEQSDIVLNAANNFLGKI